VQLEKKAIVWGTNGKRHDHETLKLELRQTTTDLSYLKLDCLRLSLFTDYQNQSAEMFRVLDRLNRLVDWLQDLTIENVDSTLSVSTPSQEVIKSLQTAIVETRRQINIVIVESRRQLIKITENSA
jgi:hypothetical protein